MPSGSKNTARPVVFLAFANEQEGKRYLRELPKEARELRAALQKAKDRGLCELEVRTNVTLPEVVEVFNHYSNGESGRLAIFHFAGHAGPDSLLLESSTGVTRVAHAQGLAQFLGQQKQGGLQLVFLNGCSTGPQVADLLAAGIDAVVATARPIEDGVAREFSVAFYTQLANGRTFRDAFTLAADQVKTHRGNNPRDLIAVAKELPAYSTEDVGDDRGFPWKLYVRDGAAAVEQESLPKLARNPLLGLPPLPPAPWLPPSPFRHLQRFTAENHDAYVFFGRGQEIADLYALVTSHNARRVILYSGATGVGKSSVLDAGVRPRLAGSHEIVYLRRDAEVGLLGTLTAGLKPPGDGLAPATDLTALWRSHDTEERPLVAILDQAEEAFTRPRAGTSPVQEVAELVRGLQALFQDPVHSPSGRLILSFRKEWLQEFERAFDARLGYEPLKLGPLNHEGIVEAIEGPTLTDELRRHYDLKIEAGLADRIAVELEHDAGAALAPTLQVLLTKMWTTAGGKGAFFTDAVYDVLKEKGFLLDDVLSEGLKTLSAWQADVVDSGFALDLLKYHTTPLGTAETRSRSDLRRRYGHRADVLEECLRLCESSYLLIPADPKPGDVVAPLSPGFDPSAREPVPTRLGHDTLAPLVRERFEKSPAPGQRARRLLENRALEWTDPAGGPKDRAVLDEEDLRSVERGLSGMRRLDQPDEERPFLVGGPDGPEHRLLAASRAARDRRRGARRLRQILGLAVLLFIIISAGVAFYEWRVAQNRERMALENLAYESLSSIGRTRGPIDRYELDALWSLAIYREEFERVRIMTLERALWESDRIEQLSNRLEPTVHAAVGLSEERRKDLLKTVVVPELQRSRAGKEGITVLRIGLAVSADSEPFAEAEGLRDVLPEELRQGKRVRGHFLPVAGHAAGRRASRRAGPRRPRDDRCWKSTENSG
jgi:hypothetical protein